MAALKGKGAQPAPCFVRIADSRRGAGNFEKVEVLNVAELGAAIRTRYALKPAALADDIARLVFAGARVEFTGQIDGNFAFCDVALIEVNRQTRPDNLPALKKASRPSAPARMKKPDLTRLKEVTE